MSLKKNKDLKLYFSISEVAQMFDVNESTLRFWEKEFDQIRPRKTGKGTRSYRQEDEQRYPFLQAGGYRRGTPHLPSG